MKKNLLIALLCVVIICVFITACSDSTTTDLSNISVLEIGCDPDTSETAGIHFSEYGIGSEEKLNPHSDSEAPQTMETTFNGKNYSGDYWYSIIESYSLSLSDYYNFDNGWFSVNRDSGKLETIVFTDFGSGDKTVDECKTYAEDIASQYIDLSQYTLVSSPGDPVHGYQFIKMIDGIETSDVLSIAISSSGDISSFSNFTNNDSNAMSKNEIPSEMSNAIEKFKSPEVTEMLEEKIYSNYENCTHYQIINQKLVRLENNEFGMVYIVDIEFEPYPLGNGEYAFPSARIELLVCETPVE